MRDDRDLEREHLLRCEIPLEDHARTVDPVGHGAHRDLRRAAHTIAAHALEHDPILPPFHRGGDRHAHIAVAAHREHVAEGRLELKLERDMRRLWVRVEYADALAQAVGEEACAPDRERLRGVASRADRRALGVHQLERRDVVLLRVRGE